MKRPELIFVVGCNAAGKSSFIRTRLNALVGFEIIMTDVYKNRTKDVFRDALKQGKNIILETVFNDSSFKDLVDLARDANYDTSLVVLFLDSPQHSFERVAFRSIEQSGLIISEGNIRINFNESFKNVAAYFIYFDNTEFIYTGMTGVNFEVMGFKRSRLVFYNATELQYPQKFARYSFNNERLPEDAFNIITSNLDFPDKKSIE
ncbi:zeta toxin family protein [Mucilaginibacter celer]|uniref:Zeta toxin domain-containing protein n=1 Tax=Mucilaginibacter celer TaxID=2305508 RepID=A0A494VQQ1_9SPHI|nr:hypothetical protein [Mucilaginibacter celer]AYL97194.1 hypothetical protein HYN43_018610 [Mucilaginibacter celer]